jgi:hypothetical protein
LWKFLVQSIPLANLQFSISSDFWLESWIHVTGKQPAFGSNQGFWAQRRMINSEEYLWCTW